VKTLGVDEHIAAEPDRVNLAGTTIMVDLTND
jgi:hypothetical protein